MHPQTPQVHREDAIKADELPMDWNHLTPREKILAQYVEKLHRQLVLSTFMVDQCRSKLVFSHEPPIYTDADSSVFKS